MTTQFILLSFKFTGTLAKENKTMCGHRRDQWPVDSDVEKNHTLDPGFGS